jgi:hypothetical protein
MPFRCSSSVAWFLDSLMHALHSLKITLLCPGSRNSYSLTDEMKTKVEFINNSLCSAKRILLMIFWNILSFRDISSFSMMLEKVLLLNVCLHQMRFDYIALKLHREGRIWFVAQWVLKKYSSWFFMPANFSFTAVCLALNLPFCNSR